MLRGQIPCSSWGINTMWLFSLFFFFSPPGTYFPPFFSNKALPPAISRTNSCTSYVQALFTLCRDILSPRRVKKTQNFGTSRVLKPFCRSGGHPFFGGKRVVRNSTTSFLFFWETHLEYLVQLPTQVSVVIGLSSSQENVGRCVCHFKVFKVFSSEACW